MRRSLPPSPPRARADGGLAPLARSDPDGHIQPAGSRGSDADRTSHVLADRRLNRRRLGGPAGRCRRGVQHGVAHADRPPADPAPVPAAAGAAGAPPSAAPRSDARRRLAGGVRRRRRPDVRLPGRLRGGRPRERAARPGAGPPEPPRRRVLLRLSAAASATLAVLYVVLHPYLDLQGPRARHRSTRAASAARC